MILHGVEIIDRSTHKRHPELQVMRMAVPGGWLYITHVCAPSDARREDHWIGTEHATAFVPDPTAEHVRRAPKAEGDRG